MVSWFKKFVNFDCVLGARLELARGLPPTGF